MACDRRFGLGLALYLAKATQRNTEFCRKAKREKANGFVKSY
jgi:hypothetical protein